MLGRLSSAHAGAMHAAVHNTAAESNLKQFQRTGLLNAFERARGDSKRLQSPKNDLVPMLKCFDIGTRAPPTNLLRTGLACFALPQNATGDRSERLPVLLARQPKAT